MTVYAGKFTELVSGMSIVDSDGSPTREFNQWAAELVGRLNNAQVLEYAGNPEANISGARNQFCRDTGTNAVYIKTTDGGNTGWVLV